MNKIKIKILGKILDTRFIFIVSMIIGLFVGIRYGSDAITLSFAIKYFLLIAFILSVSYLLIEWQMQKYIKELDEKCDPYKFLKLIEEIEKNIKDSDLKNAIMLYKVVGLDSIGNYKEGIETIKKINVKKLSKYGKGIYCNNIASCYIGENELEKVEEELNKYSEVIQGYKKEKEDVKKIKDLYKINRTTNDIFMKKLEDDAIIQLEDIFSNTKKLRVKIKCKLTMGYYYYFKENKSKAKECFEYVIENGNKLYSVKQAQEYLEKIKGE